MPKVAGPPQSTNTHQAVQAGVLKRNQACHQCRKRNDARRPCSTCVRSHSHAIAHAQPGQQLPPHPECTFDEAIENNASVPDGPKNRVERLENRILELEALLRQKDQTPCSRNASEGPSSSQPSSAAVPLLTSEPSINGPIYDEPSLALTTQANQVDINQIYPDSYFLSEDSDFSSSHSDIFWNHWPPHLPNPDLLRHLVETFFAFHPHSTRLVHMPTFMASLSLPPTHPDFPIPAVLHAICAVSSTYTAAIQVPIQQLGSLRQETFAEQQARLAKEQVDQFIANGHQLWQCFQACVALTWYYWCNANCGHSMRFSVPLGLNMKQPFHSITDKVASLSLIPPARTFAEDETRRNAFWLAYAIDRQHGAGTGWALALADDDIAQTLPARLDAPEESASSALDSRQWSHLQETLLNHPPHCTDSFTLYIKSTMLLSRVKSFNVRFRAKQHAGDPSSMPRGTVRNSLKLDLRTAPAFFELDDLVASFRTSLPHHLRDPFANGGLDSHLYTTYLTVYATTIILHEPHANVESMRCTSAMKMLVGARGILDLLYALWSTSYDLSLLDYFCPFCWYLAGRALARFLRAAKDANCAQQVRTLNTDLDFFRMALVKMGQRVPLAGQYFVFLSLTN
ncbi:hypothetical protein BV22DRAFT_1101451 [Leucogyrophana mollusca]|uniref:Uncharacterized protein n=1 Tax=Leucogyrophana mollusca TaxID=85980 RepID=A0ACB8BZD7_9AGAM|nr:hypothetical protein BV22DRAFT_1101451 [Leucogyrophana mollusca]